ncbi:MAG: N-acetyl-gamma-glutamyl-phosphate reductase [Magnetococcales bacterium]|nr:N-acetyl-gamma-glutamyl-phosphate reductase [Magnetococcales bacterium]
MGVRVGILGASGYTGGELARLLCRHPGVELGLITSERNAGKPLSAAFPHLRGVAEGLRFQKLTAEAAQGCDILFGALPHKVSMSVVPGLLAAGQRVIDLSADFRLKDAAVYADWYGLPHQAPDLLKEAVYGQPELNRAAIPGARLVANPGCYPTSVQLALAPFVRAGAVDERLIVVDSKSGVSGAGRSPSEGTQFAELSDGFRAYKVERHRHTPEMEQELSRLAGRPLTIRFTPHLLPQVRGILSTCYLMPKEPRSAAQWRELMVEFYQGETFVRVLPAGELAGTAAVRGSNYCDLSVSLDPRTGWVVVLAALDNLVKGAAGQAVQNMNLLLGLPETAGLTQAPLFP